DRAVARFRAAVADGDDRNLVGRCLLGQREGDPRRQGKDVGRSGRALGLEPLIALDPAVGCVAEVALLEHDLDAVDTAVPFVHQPVVIGDAVGERDAVRSIGPRPIDQARYELLVLRKGRRPKRNAAERRHSKRQMLQHGRPSLPGRSGCQCRGPVSCPRRIIVPHPNSPCPLHSVCRLLTRLMILKAYATPGTGSMALRAAAAHQYGNDRRRSGHVTDTLEPTRMTQLGPEWPLFAAMHWPDLIY